MSGQVAYILLSQALFQAVIAWQYCLGTAASTLALFATAGAALVIRRARPRGGNQGKSRMNPTTFHPGKSGKSALQAGRSEV